MAEWAAKLRIVLGAATLVDHFHFSGGVTMDNVGEVNVSRLQELGSLLPTVDDLKSVPVIAVGLGLAWSLFIVVIAIFG